MEWVRELYCNKGVRQDRVARITGIPLTKVTSLVREQKMSKGSRKTCLSREQIRLNKLVRTEPVVLRFMKTEATGFPDLGIGPLSPNITSGHQHLNGVAHGPIGPRLANRPQPPRTCEWPMAIEGSRKTRKCGAPAHKKHPYCEEHCRAAYTNWV
jgi:hypothetical protein